jgi:hypothetical protein
MMRSQRLLLFHTFSGDPANGGDLVASFRNEHKYWMVTTPGR